MEIKWVKIKDKFMKKILTMKRLEINLQLICFNSFRKINLSLKWILICKDPNHNKLTLFNIDNQFKILKWVYKTLMWIPMLLSIKSNHNSKIIRQLKWIKYNNNRRKNKKSKLKINNWKFWIFLIIIVILILRMNNLSINCSKNFF